MARTYKKHRAARRTPYETYSYWYDVKTKSEKGKRKYHEKLTVEEFEKVYKEAKDLGWKNPAKTIAEKQRKILYDFQKNYEEATGTKLTVEDFETKEARENLFFSFAALYENGEIAREEFEALY